MTRKHFAEAEVLFKEGDPPSHVFRLVSGAVDIFRELDGELILLGNIGAGQFIGEMSVVENRPRSATARAASEVEVEIFTPAEFFDQIAGSPQTARELIHRLSQRLRWRPESDPKLGVIVRTRGGASIYFWNFAVSVRCADSNRPLPPFSQVVPNDIAANLFNSVGTVEISEYREPNAPILTARQCPS